VCPRTTQLSPAVLVIFLLLFRDGGGRIASVTPTLPSFGEFTVEVIGSCATSIVDLWSDGWVWLGGSPLLVTPRRCGTTDDLPVVTVVEVKGQDQFPRDGFSLLVAMEGMPILLVGTTGNTSTNFECQVCAS
jgi:hypothetical protein